MSRDSFTYTHGDTGSAPSSSLDFQQNQRPDAQNFDWYWYNVIEAIKGHASEFERLDSDDDGIVDKADLATDANALEGNSASYFVADGTDIIGTTRLDESIAPTWSGEHTFSSGITGLPAPSNSGDAARKGYVDSETSTLQSSSDVDHDSTTGGTSGNPHANSASTNHGNDDENYTLQINGITVSSGDTINFQT